MCLFVFLCDTSYPNPFILFYLFHSSITVLLLSNYILSRLPRLRTAGWCSKQEDHSSYKVLRLRPPQLPCSHPAPESSSQTVNPNQPRGCFCFNNSVQGESEEPVSLLRDQQTTPFKNSLVQANICVIHRTYDTYSGLHVQLLDTYKHFHPSSVSQDS